MAITIGATITDFVLGSGVLLEAIGIAGTVAVNTTIGIATIVGVDYAVQSALRPGINSEAARQQVTTRQPIPPRRKYYGRCKSGGYFAFIQTDSSNLYEVILIASHEIDFIDHWIGDRLVTVNGSGDVSAPSSMLDDSIKRFHIYEKAGTVTQTAHSQLVSAFASLWTSNHKLLGIANVLFKQDGVEAKKLQRFYPGGPQPYRALFDASRVYDVNDGGQDPDDSSTWDFGHDNAANVIRDFIISPDGMRLPRSTVIDPSAADWAAAAAICDETINLAAGGTDRRYRIAGGYDLSVPPKETLSKMLTACDGYLSMKPNGALSLQVGKWEAPTITISDAHIRGFNLPKGLGPLREANEIRASFTDPIQDYQPVEALPWRDEDDIASRGAVISKQIDLSFAPTHNQARRIMKIAQARSNPERAGTITTDLYGLNLIGERRVHLIIEKRNIELDCEITSFSIDMTTQSCIVGVLAVSADAYEFDEDTEELSPGTVPPTGSDNPSTTAPSAPTGIVANNVAGTVTVMFSAPNDVNVYACRVWRGTSTFGAATDISGLLFCAPNQFISRTDTPGSGTWNYWATAESASGASSAENGPATVIVV